MGDLGEALRGDLDQGRGQQPQRPAGELRKYLEPAGDSQQCLLQIQGQTGKCFTGHSWIKTAGRDGWDVRRESGGTSRTVFISNITYYKPSQVPCQ